jgi:hypothetical protein
MVLQVGIAIVEVVAAICVLALVARRRHHLRPREAVFCASNIGAIGALTWSLAAFRAPGWLILTGGASFIAMVVGWFATAVWTPRSSSHDQEPAEPSRKDDPWWWAEFERELRAYTRAKRGPARNRPALRRVTGMASRRVRRRRAGARSAKRSRIGGA